MTDGDALVRGIAALGLDIAAPKAAQLERYLDLLEKWNRVYNLTAIRERPRMITHHVLDSLAVLRHIRGPVILDVGSGAGLPGIPLAIADAGLQVTLLDSNSKKCAFMQQAVGELGLDNATVVAQRVETWQTASRFDTIVSRAFAELGEFVAACARLLAPEGVLAAMKGVHPYDEIERLPAGFRVAGVARLVVPGLGAERHLVSIERAA